MAESLFDLLQKDHDKVRTILEELADTTERAEKSRRSSLEKLKSEIMPHMRAEEQAFYSRLQEIGATKDVALEAFEEHHVAELVLGELEQLAPTDERWHAKLTVLQELIEHHVDEEEGEVFDQAGEVLDDETLDEIAQQVTKIKQRHKQKVPAMA